MRPGALLGTLRSVLRTSRAQQRNGAGWLDQSRDAHRSVAARPRG
jgi:hypothetical protein